MRRRFGSRILLGVGLAAFGLLNIGESWHTVQAVCLVVSPIVFMAALMALLVSTLPAGLPESIDDAFGFDGRGIDAQDSTD